MADLVKLTAFVERAEAVIAKGVLEASGIHVLAPELYTLGADPGLVFALGGYRLLVREDQLAAAQALLSEIGASTPETRGEGSAP